MRVWHRRPLRTLSCRWTSRTRCSVARLVALFIPLSPCSVRVTPRPAWIGAGAVTALRCYRVSTPERSLFHQPPTLLRLADHGRDAFVTFVATRSPRPVARFGAPGYSDITSSAGGSAGHHHDQRPRQGVLVAVISAQADESSGAHQSNSVFRPPGLCPLRHLPRSTAL
jgi:hypothetical protein